MVGLLQINQRGGLTLLKSDSALLKSIILGLTALVFSTLSYSQESQGCPEYTPEQTYILKLAYTIAQQPDPEVYEALGGHLGHTFAAIIAQESFVWRHIQRFSTSDGDMGSWGLGHVTVETMLHYEGLDNNFKNRTEAVPDWIALMLTDDIASLRYSYEILKTKIVPNSFYMTRMRYNGGGGAAQNYAVKVGEVVNVFIRCGMFKNG